MYQHERLVVFLPVPLSPSSRCHKKVSKWRPKPRWRRHYGIYGWRCSSETRSQKFTHPFLTVTDYLEHALKLRSDITDMQILFFHIALNPSWFIHGVANLWIICAPKQPIMVLAPVLLKARNLGRWRRAWIDHRPLSFLKERWGETDSVSPHLVRWLHWNIDLFKLSQCHCHLSFPQGWKWCIGRKPTQLEHRRRNT